MSRIFGLLRPLGAAGCALAAVACSGGDLVLPEDGAPAGIAMVSGDDQTAAVAAALDDPLVVRVTDQFGNPVPGVRVEWAASAGSVDPVVASTGADGHASTRRVLGATAGTQTATASSAGLDGSPVRFTHTATGGGGGGGGDGGGGPSDSRSTVSASSASILAVVGSSTITVTVKDDGDSPIAGASVTLSATGEGNVLTQPGQTTNSNGVTTGALKSTQPGTKTVSATVNGTVRVTQTATVTVTVAPIATSLGFNVQPSSTDEDEQISPPVQVEVLDQEGIRVTDRRLTIRLELVGGDSRARLKGPASRETDDGVATFDDLKVDREGTGYRLRASVEGLPPVESNPFNVFDD